MSDEKSATSKSAINVREMCYVAMFTAVISILAQISIPLPLGVPLTMQTFAITLAAVVLGAIGVPVLANFSAGLDKFVGPTGGFLFSFPLMAFIIGYGVEHKDMFKGAYIVFLILGTVANYVVGVVMFCFLTSSNLATGISACVLPFIPTAIIKAVLASYLGFIIRKRLPR